MIWIRAASRSTTACELPLYGICVRAVPVSRANSSANRCVAVPMPDDPKEKLPGFACAPATKSATDWGPEDGTTSSTGTSHTFEIGARSSAKSNDSLLRLMWQKAHRYYCRHRACSQQ